MQLSGFQTEPNNNKIQPNPSNERLEKKREMKETIINHQKGIERERDRERTDWEMQWNEKITLTQFARME